jgi:hypothetical protein
MFCIQCLPCSVVVPAGLLDHTSQDASVIGMSARVFLDPLLLHSHGLGLFGSGFTQNRKLSEFVHDV